MIKNINFLSGKGISSVNTNFLTIFVGPNNSGKSRTLDDIKQKIGCGQTGTHTLTVNFLGHSIPTEFEINVFLEKVRKTGRVHLQCRGDEVCAGMTLSSFSGGNFTFNVDGFSLEELLKNDDFLYQYRRYHILQVEVFNRLYFPYFGEVLEEKRNDAIKNYMIRRHLQKNAEKKVEWQECIKKILGLSSDIEERHERLVVVLLGDSNKPPYNELKFYGSGFQAVVYIIAYIVCSDAKIFLIDEPDLFLHPTLSYRFAKELSRLIRQKNGQAFFSTNNAHFLMGLLHASGDLKEKISIIRLSRINGVSHRNQLSELDVEPLFSDPYLRSTHAIQGLFSERVVVVEADTDRVVYEAANERLIKEGAGIENCLFINAHNKQTIHRISAIFKKLNIPVAGIFDFDFIGNSVAESKNVSDALSVFSENLNSNLSKINIMLLLANTVFVDAASIEGFKKNGLRTSGIPGFLCEEILSIIEDLANSGVFVVPWGALESFVSDKEKKSARRGSKIDLEKTLISFDNGSFYGSYLIDFFSRIRDYFKII